MLLGLPAEGILSFLAGFIMYNMPLQKEEEEEEGRKMPTGGHTLPHQDQIRAGEAALDMWLIYVLLPRSEAPASFPIFGIWADILTNITQGLPSQSASLKLSHTGKEGTGEEGRADRGKEKPGTSLGQLCS